MFKDKLVVMNDLNPRNASVSNKYNLLIFDVPDENQIVRELTSNNMSSGSMALRDDIMWVFSSTLGGYCFIFGIDKNINVQFTLKIDFGKKLTRFCPLRHRIFLCVDAFWIASR